MDEESLLQRIFNEESQLKFTISDFNNLLQKETD